MNGLEDIGSIYQTEKSPGYWIGADPRDLYAIMPSVQVCLSSELPYEVIKNDTQKFNTHWSFW